MVLNEIKLKSAQDTTVECINGSIGVKLREFFFQHQSPKGSSNSGCTIVALKAINSFLNSVLTDFSLQVYCDHLDKMHFDMTTRFGYLINLCIPTWVSQLLLNTEYKGLGFVEEELIYLKNKSSFRRIRRV